MTTEDSLLLLTSEKWFISLTAGNWEPFGFAYDFTNK